ncbi:MAG TPA: HlyD family efflux transporter periplasmic adaptor subunit [Terracidiphilus sp.]|nr:HlyD family efflux transporter periplasmic adaptor subunit [Terracidiphilus sp.]
MNLSEALDAALPEIPQARLVRTRPPRLDPDLIVRDDTLDGEPIVGLFKREKGNYFRFDPPQWDLAQLFDGVRSYQEIADEFTASTGAPMGAADVQVFADTLEEAGFWYKNPQEKNLALNQKLMAQRERRAARKSKVSLAHIGFSAWDPDRYLTWLDSRLGKYIYSPWVALSAVVLFCFEASIFASNWSFIGPDIALYFNFVHKALPDLIQFWFLIFVLGFIHETAHGLTCKHFGGQVHQMGFMFLYLAPCFYCDVTEIWISATKLQRLATIIAGIWIELIICGCSMIVWLNSPPGAWIHDLTYQLILITGIAVVILNLNPLIKLDGYYLLTEIIGIPDLKERSTAFLTGWFQSRVLRLPVDTMVVPRRRVLLFIFYAIASGFYSYVLLFFVVRLSFNIAYHWLADFALIPSGILFFMMFKSRLKSLRKVAQQFWSQKLGTDRVLRPLPLIAAAGLLALLLLPLWRDRENAYFVIEPVQSETLHAAVPGRVNEVMVYEGEHVRAGQPLLTMTSPQAASMIDSAVAQTRDAGYQAFNAELQRQSIGSAAALQNASRRSTALASEAQSSLRVAAPHDAIVLTPDAANLLGRQVGSGQPLLDLADDGTRTVRIYIPAAALQRVYAGADVALELPGRFSPVHLTLAQPGGDAVSLPEGLVKKQELQGIRLPVFYTARMVLPATAGEPPLGESGPAKIFGRKRSLAGRAFAMVWDVVRARVW